MMGCAAPEMPMPTTLVRRLRHDEIGGTPMKTRSQRPQSCGACRASAPLGFDFTMAFQPIVNADDGSIFAHEALVRGPNNEPAASVFASVNDTNRYRFDQLCRVRAVQLAAALGIDSMVSVNFMPNTVRDPERCIQSTLQAAEDHGFPVRRIIFEIVEHERVADIRQLRNVAEHYRHIGFTVAIDDFGVGASGLQLLAEIPADLLKLDRLLIRDVHKDRTRRCIIRGLLQTAGDLSMRVVAEGVERYEEFATLRTMGIGLFQGFLFARPAFRRLTEVPASAFQPPGD